MVKVYYEYSFLSTIGQPINGQCNFAILPQHRLIIAGVNQYVVIMGLKTGQALEYLYEEGRNINVRVVKVSEERLYVGYEDGRISVYEMTVGKEGSIKKGPVATTRAKQCNLNFEYITSLEMHKTAITSIDIDENDTKMISGCMSGTMCIWDLLSGQIHHKVQKAHSSAIISVRIKSLIIKGKMVDCVFTLSRDGFLKLWNTDSRLCLAAVTTQTTEAYGMAMDELAGLIYVATNKEVIPIVRYGQKVDKESQSPQNQRPSFSNTNQILEIVGMAKRPNYSRVVQINIIEGRKIFLLNSDKKLQIYQLISAQKINKKAQLKLKRKNQNKNHDKDDGNKNNQQEAEQLQRKSLGVEADLVQKKLEESTPNPNQYELRVSFLQEKTFLEKIHNFQIIEEGAITSSSQQQYMIYFNNGKNIFRMSPSPSNSSTALLQPSSQPASTQISKFSTITQQIQYQFPYLIQRTNDSVIYVYAYSPDDEDSSFNLLYTIEPTINNKISHFSLFGGFLMFCGKQEMKIWDLAKNQDAFSMLKEWTGCWASSKSKGKCLLWKDNMLGVYEIGYSPSSKRIKAKQIQTKILQQKISPGTMLSPDLQHYAVNLQNCQIHLFHTDTNRLNLKLYGHKLPVTDLDISSDNSLLVSGSVDKDIRVWDMQFGHCIKAIFAHQLALTKVVFIPNTHYVVSTGKDGHLKMWDVDVSTNANQLIQDFDESMQELRALAVSESGDFLCAGGMDGGFRVWKQGGNQVVAADQEEKRLEKVLVEEYSQRKLANSNDGNKTTGYEDLKHGEQVIEALEALTQQSGAPKNALIKMLKKIPASNLQSSLSFLHLQHRLRLQNYIEYYIQREYEIQTCYKILDALQSTCSLGPKLRSQFQERSSTLGVNKEVLRVLLKAVKERKMQLF